MKTNSDIKLFTIPRTGAFIKDVLIPEKTNSRNVTEIFDDIKSCALDTYFDFAREQCHACDSIRNPKLQKFYNERRNAMKKEQDPVERFAFFLVSTRNQASTIANEGLACDALPTNIDKFLGNPKDGVHLCRRPDILLVSASQRRLKTFGLLVCKILIGKGFPTIPSVQNDQFPAQLHFDHHFCKIHSTSSEPVTLESLILKSLIFCYEHQEFKTISRPSQILPVAVIWYQLKERFTFHLPMLTKSLSNEKKFISRKMNNIQNVSRRSSDSTMETSKESNLPTIPTKIDSNPFERVDHSPTSPSTSKKLITSCRLPIPETIPISPQKIPPTIPSRCVVPIPHDSLTVLNDPRSKTSQQNQFVCYLDTKSIDSILVKDQLHTVTDPLSVKKKDSHSNYYLIPLIIRDEWENQTSLWSENIEIPSLSISVIDCCTVGFDRSSDKNFIDLEQTQNQFIYEQIEFANHLTQEKKRLQSIEIRIRMNERRQQKLQGQVKNQDKIFTSTLKSTDHYEDGRKLLNNHELPTSYTGHLSNDLINLFAYEYRHETQAYVKHLIAELMGVLIGKYSYQSQTQATSVDTNNQVEHSNQTEQRTLMVPTVIPISTIQMNSESSALSQVLGDRDERFDQNPSINLIENNDHPLNSNLQQGNVDTIMSMDSVHEQFHQSMNRLNHRSLSINNHLDTNPESNPVSSMVDLHKMDTSLLISSNDADERQTVLPNSIVEGQISLSIASSESNLNRKYTNDLGTKQTRTKNNEDARRSLSPSQMSSTSMRSTSTHSSSSYSVSNSKQEKSSNRREEFHKRPYLKRFRLSNRSDSTSRIQSNKNQSSTRTYGRTFFKNNHTKNSPNYFHEQRLNDQDYNKLIPPLMEISTGRSPFFQDSSCSYRLFEEQSISSIPPLMSTVPSGNFTTSSDFSIASSSYDQKPSNVIERLQKYLQNRQ